MGEIEVKESRYCKIKFDVERYN